MGSSDGGGTPLVTVVIGCYDHERYVLQALAAVEAQTYPRIQLVVTDDASRDGSADLIAGWLAEHAPEATFIRHAVNVGVTRTINQALAVADGAFVTMISADDWMEPHRTERLVRAFEAVPQDVAVVSSGVRIVGPDGQELGRLHDQPGSGPSGWIFHEQLTGQKIPTPAAMVRRSVYDDVGGYDEDDYAEDYDMWLRICRSYQVRHVPEVLVNYRLHGTNMSLAANTVAHLDYQTTCLRRHLGYSPETDAIIRSRLVDLRAAREAATAAEASGTS